MIFQINLTIMKTKILFLLSIIILIFNNTVVPQNATATITSVQACDSTEITVSLDITNFYDVGAVSLYLSFDTLVLSWLSVENIHPEFSGLLYNFMTSPIPQLGFSWTGLNGANVMEGTLCDIKFLFKSGTTPINFNPWCEVVTTDLEEIIVDYSNGFIIPIISIVQQPQSITVLQGNAAEISIEAVGVNTYQWQMSSDQGNTFSNIDSSELFSGVNSSQLTINTSELILNGMFFRCMLSGNNCQVFSDIAFLEIIPEQLQQTMTLTAGWNGFSFKIDPGFDSIQNFLDIIQSEVIFLTDSISFYYPAANLNTFQSIDPKKAFLVKVAESACVEIPGTLHENTEIFVPQGWSMIPVLSLEDHAIEDVFEDFADDLVIIKEVAGFGVYWPQFDVNTIQYLKPGKAYLIKTNNSFNLYFP